MSKLLKLAEIESPIGTLTAGFTEDGLALLSFYSLDTVKIPTGLSELEVAHTRAALHEQLKTELDAYFAGTLTEFSLPVDLYGTEFQKKVWKALLKVPFGTTRSYKEQSIYFGDVKAIRAVATANGANPIAIVVPCHRIVGSDQSLTGYSGGLERKQFLLELESYQTRLNL